MAKKKLEKPRRELTKRQRSRRQQQKRRQRIIFGVAIFILVAVLSVIGVGVYNSWYIEDYKPLHETVLEVNGTKFDMEYYTNMLAYVTYTSGLSLEYASFMADSAVRAIETNELVLQAAAELGITVSEDELEEFLNSQNPPVEEKYWDIVRVQLIVQKLRDEYFEEQVPKYADQRHIMAMFLEGEAQANEVAAMIEDGGNFDAFAAELSLDETTKEAGGDLGWLPLGILPLTVDSTILEESAFSAEVGVLSQPIYEETKTRQLGYWLVEVIEADAAAEPAEAQVRRMLLASEQEALDIKAKLEEGGDFAALAMVLSLDTAASADGGEITVSPGETTDAFDYYVFDPEVEWGVLSQPIKDDGVTLEGGYWLIEVMASEADREIDEENRLILKSEALNSWVARLMDDPDNIIVNNLDEEKIQWAVAHIMGGEE